MKSSTKSNLYFIIFLVILGLVIFSIHSHFRGREGIDSTLNPNQPRPDSSVANPVVVTGAQPNKNTDPLGYANYMVNVATSKIAEIQQKITDATTVRGQKNTIATSANADFNTANAAYTSAMTTYNSKRVDLNTLRNTVISAVDRQISNIATAADEFKKTTTDLATSKSSLDSEIAKTPNLQKAAKTASDNYARIKPVYDAKVKRNTDAANAFGSIDREKKRRDDVRTQKERAKNNANMAWGNSKKTKADLEKKDAAQKEYDNAVKDVNDYATTYNNANSEKTTAENDLKNYGSTYNPVLAANNTATSALTANTANIKKFSDSSKTVITDSSAKKTAMKDKASRGKEAATKSLGDSLTTFNTNVAYITDLRDKIQDYTTKKLNKASAEADLAEADNNLAILNQSLSDATIELQNAQNDLDVLVTGTSRPTVAATTRPPVAAVTGTSVQAMATTRPPVAAVTGTSVQAVTSAPVSSVQAVATIRPPVAAVAGTSVQAVASAPVSSVQALAIAIPTASSLLSSAVNLRR